MRVPIGVSLASRDGTVSKDAKVQNAFIETNGDQTSIRKRPGNSDLGLVKVGVAQLLYYWNGIQAILGDYLNTGTISTIISAPVQTNLSPTNASLPWSAQVTGSGAATQLMMIKNRTQAKTVNRAGTVSPVTFASAMGSATYNLVSLTRSGTVATGTVGTDPGYSVGDSVTIAGAVEGAYNGVQTITGAVAGSFTPARDVPISSVTRSSTTATATSVAHGLISTTYTISGANETAYNGAKAITVVDADTFTYTVTVTTDTVTWNPSDKAAAVTLSGGNLVASATATPNGMVRGTIGKASGKWYWEVTFNSGSLGLIGVANATETLTNNLGATVNSWSYMTFGGGGRKYHVSQPAYGSGYVTGDVIGVALDMDAGTLTFYVNGVTQGQAFTGITGTIYPAVGSYALYASSYTSNFGNSALAYTPPVGYSTLVVPPSPATGTIIITDPAVTVNSTFTYTVGGSPSTPATGTITVSGTGGTVPGIPYIDGYFCVMDVNGVIWSSALDDPTTWPALSFTTAQAESGAGKALGKSQNYLIAFKEWSTEFFYDRQDGAVGSPFSPVQNGFTQVGCAAGFSLAQIGESLLWMAQLRQRGRSIYLMQGLQQQKISTPDIDRILNADDLATVHAFGMNLDGHPIYILTLVSSNITLAYDLSSQTWAQWTSLTVSAVPSISSITRSGDVATVTTALAHGLSDGDPVTISGATQTEYNGFKQIGYVSPTMFTFQVATTAATPATGTIIFGKFTESYFKFTKYANAGGVDLLLHESDGHLYAIDSALYKDAGIPINVFARTVRMDGGSTANKKMPVIRVIGDAVDDILMVRTSNDDCATFTAFRIVDLSEAQPEIRRCGSFRRRTIELRHVGNKPLQLSALELEVSQ